MGLMFFYELPHEKNGFEFHIGESKDADQLCSNRKADQRLCFCYIESITNFM